MCIIKDVNSKPSERFFEEKYICRYDTQGQHNTRIYVNNMFGSNVFFMVFSRHLKVNWKFWQVQVVCSVAQLGYQSMRKIRAIKKKNKKRILCLAIANETLSEVYAFWYQRSQWLCFQKRFALTYWSTDLENPPTKMNSLHLIFILYANVCTIFL